MTLDYQIQPGDCISSIAERFGFVWQTLWNANPELKKLRKNPNVLLPGDTVKIPDKVIKQEACNTDQSHKFVKKGTPAKFVLILERFNIPLANRRYILEIDGKLYDGKTDAIGRLEVSIDPAARTGQLRMPDDGLECALELGNLDPVEEMIGVQQRLQNLGFYSGPLDGAMNEEMADALIAFQSSVNLEPTGELDDSTRDKLLQMQDKIHPQRQEEHASPEAPSDEPEPENPEPDIDPEEDEAEMARFTSLDS
jgi:N-acetylmuramoyl-L-alanine amidase